jgi:8-oxo-dGTP pyrophosphatase MutT (NUDIX family)
MTSKHHITAGGVVLDDRDCVLTLVRDVERDGGQVHEVRLPKGHIDPGETPEAAALREVREESGYAGLEIEVDLGTAHSEFDFRGKHHTRDERYFLMRLTRPERQAPEPTGPEEALFSPEWLELEEAEKRLSYASEREFARRAREYRQTRRTVNNLEGNDHEQ